MLKQSLLDLLLRLRQFVMAVGFGAVERKKLKRKDGHGAGEELNRSTGRG